jgi:hypothetical protein
MAEAAEGTSHSTHGYSPSLSNPRATPPAGGRRGAAHSSCCGVGFGGPGFCAGFTLAAAANPNFNGAIIILRTAASCAFRFEATCRGRRAPVGGQCALELGDPPIRDRQVALQRAVRRDATPRPTSQQQRSTVQHRTPRCSTVHHAATRRAGLQPSARRCNAAQHVATQRTELQRTTTCRNAVHRTCSVRFLSRSADIASSASRSTACACAWLRAELCVLACMRARAYVGVRARARARSCACVRVRVRVRERGTSISRSSSDPPANPEMRLKHAAAAPTRVSAAWPPGAIIGHH